MNAIIRQSRQAVEAGGQEEHRAGRLEASVRCCLRSGQESISLAEHEVQAHRKDSTHHSRKPQRRKSKMDPSPLDLAALTANTPIWQVTLDRISTTVSAVASGYPAACGQLAYPHRPT
jgi:hypothetical protein